MRRLPALALVYGLALAAAGCRAAPQAEQPRLGLMTTLPLYWVEAGGVGEVLRGGASASWVRRALEQHYALEPLDTLDEASLKGLERLLLAQPRALGPAENVALDAWVRGGGRLLLFADPMLTRHSRYGLGDRRRPQDVVLLSPILTHWGLELRFDPDQDEGERRIDLAGTPVPVALAGTLRAQPRSGCIVSAEEVLARCTLGRGVVVVLADAALLDDAEDGGAQVRAAALDRITALAFD